MPVISKACPRCHVARAVRIADTAPPAGPDAAGSGHEIASDRVTWAAVWWCACGYRAPAGTQGTETMAERTARMAAERAARAAAGK